MGVSVGLLTGVFVGEKVCPSANGDLVGDGVGSPSQVPKVTLNISNLVPFERYHPKRVFNGDSVLFTGANIEQPSWVKNAAKPFVKSNIHQQFVSFDDVLLILTQ